MKRDEKKTEGSRKSYEEGVKVGIPENAPRTSAASI